MPSPQRCMFSQVVRGKTPTLPTCTRGSNDIILYVFTQRCPIVRARPHADDGTQVMMTVIPMYSYANMARVVPIYFFLFHGGTLFHGRAFFHTLFFHGRALFHHRSFFLCHGLLVFVSFTNQ